MPIPDDAADAAATSVRQAFLRRSLAVPLTRLGAVEVPAPAAGGHWHYWWQAHLLDCLIDAGLRDPASGALAEARRLARGIWLRNGARWRNAYYDDMAWLTLALQRLDGQDGGQDGGRRRNRRRVRVLGAALRSADTDDLGGGVWWNTTRDYKNTPSTAPAALFFARAGENDRAQGLLDWLHARLFDASTGLYLDGIRADGSVEGTVHTYNQGTVLGALVTVGGPTNLERAAQLIAAVEHHLADHHGSDHHLADHHGSDHFADRGGSGPLPLAAAGDAGLFTGILVRYLALAAGHPGLAPDAATTARGLVRATAEHIWDGRRLDEAGHLVFPPAHDGPVPLSSQVQAWTVLEAERECRLR